MTDMSLSNVTVGRLIRPLRIALYGTDGVGKTSFAAGASNPIFIATEDGTHHVNTARFPVPQTWADIVGPEGALAKLCLEDHDFETVVIDSMDWAEALCDAHVIQRYNDDTSRKNKIASLSDIPYGGWKALKMTTFMMLLDRLSILVRERNMNVITISHATIGRFEDPERETYERYELALYPSLAAKLREWSDYVLFANFDTTLTEVGQGFHTRQVGTSHGKRLLYSQRRAAFDAKSRFNIPERLPLTWDAFWAAHCAAINEEDGG